MISGDACPECGWEGMKEGERVESPMVWLWRKQWDMDYLEDAGNFAKRYVKGMVSAFVFIVGLMIVMLLLSGDNPNVVHSGRVALGMAIVLCMLMIVQSTINYVRVRQYIRRKDEKESAEEVENQV